MTRVRLSLFVSPILAAMALWTEKADAVTASPGSRNSSMKPVVCAQLLVPKEVPAPGEAPAPQPLQTPGKKTLPEQPLQYEERATI